jgi:hypothetical protein
VSNALHRLVGDPPQSEAAPSIRLRWIRRFYSRLSLPLLILLCVAAAVSAAPVWIWIVLALSAIIVLAGYIAITVRIRRHSA